ncbi:MAG: flavin monoamine oxidase family protein [Lewinella sp.]|uniref:flavin monoamine oxidase family protein n=1 Tax=Lewinella sp. TaxID=2004506 RepID=UPI003D6B3096
MSFAPVLIIGAGLSGLTTAYRLQQANIPFAILEARDRIGGRILTVRNETGTPIEMGATWLGKKHTAINALLAELGIEITEQYMGKQAIYEALSTSPPQLVQLPPNNAPSYRIVGTSTSLIEALAKRLSKDAICLSQVVQKIEKIDDGFTVHTQDTTFRANAIVSTLPPRLLMQTVECAPSWPEALRTIANQTHTWMGESIKVGFSYPTPFWRAKGLSGTLFSNVGPVGEMYDHSDDGQGYYALKGFLNGVYHSLTKAERCELVLQQLRKYYGNQVDQYTTYEEGVWRLEPYTFTDYDQSLLPHQNNGHAIFRQPLFGERFFIGGAETASEFPGYMDGAVRRGEEIAVAIIAQQ